MDPFLIASKLFWLIAEPASFLFTLWLLGTVLLWTAWRRLGRWLVTVSAVANQGRCKFILARCGTVSGLLYAHKHGIDLVQGRAVDTVLRKGVKITEAIRTAMMLDE